MFELNEGLFSHCCSFVLICRETVNLCLSNRLHYTIHFHIKYIKDKHFHFLYFAIGYEMFCFFV